MCLVEGMVPHLFWWQVLRTASAGREVPHSTYSSSCLTKLLMDYVGDNGRCLLLAMLPSANTSVKVLSAVLLVRHDTARSMFPVLE